MDLIPHWASLLAHCQLCHLLGGEAEEVSQVELQEPEELHGCQDDENQGFQRGGASYPRDYTGFFMFHKYGKKVNTIFDIFFICI